MSAVLTRRQKQALMNAACGQTNKRDRNWEALKAQNLNMWEQKYDLKNALQRGADASLKAAKPQKPCDIGLFSDDAAQLDLCEMFQQPTNEE